MNWRFKIVLSILLIFFIQITLAQSIKKIEGYLAKKDFKSSRYYLNKILAKNPHNAAAEYLYAKYYLYQPLSINLYDSAYFHIQKAIKYFPTSSLKNTKQWAKKGNSLNNASILKKQIDSLAFEIVNQPQNLNLYQYYLIFYPSSDYYKKAELNLHELAFQQAFQSNNTDSLKKFIDSYPFAIQINEAQKRYDILIFENQTKKGSLKDFEEFVQKNPDNPFRRIAEKHIFQLTTLSQQLKDYETFIIKYPNNFLQGTARQWLYNLFKEDHNETDFFLYYPHFKNDVKWNDLIKTNSKILYPILEEEKYGFIDDLGNTIITSRIDSVPTNYFCDGIKENIIQVYNKFKLVLLDKKGEEITKENIEKIEFFESGFYKTFKNLKKGLIYESGYEILPPIYDSIILINDKIILSLHNDNILLFSLNGKELFKGKNYEIQSFADSLLIFKNENKFCLIACNYLFDNPNPTLKFDIDSIKILDDFALKIIKNNEEYILLSPHLNINQFLDTTSISKTEEILMQKYTNVYPTKNGFKVKNKDQKYGFFDKKGIKVLNVKYDEIEVWKENIFKIKLNDQTGIIDNKEKIILPPRFDGLSQIENGYIATIQKGKFGIIQLKNKISISPEFESLPYLYDKKQKLFIVKKKGKLGWISEKNEKLSEFKFDEIQYWQPSVALVRIDEFWHFYNISTKEILFKPIEKLFFSKDYNKQKSIKVLVENKYGLISNQSGVVIDLEYNSLNNIGTAENPFYVAEKYIKDVDVYLLYYINKEGKTIRKQVLTQDLYEKISCE